MKQYLIVEVETAVDMPEVTTEVALQVLQIAGIKDVTVRKAQQVGPYDDDFGKEPKLFTPI